MGPRSARLRIDASGQLEIIDPGLGEWVLLRAIDPDFQIRSATLPGFESPRVLQSRQQRSGCRREDLAGGCTGDLWSLHDRLVAAQRRAYIPSSAGHPASVLDVKIELARRLLADCCLCARRCGVNRWQGPRGVCQLGTEARVAEAFIHIAEEAPINPSLVLNLSGCGLRCVYCQQTPLLDPLTLAGTKLTPALWSTLPAYPARSVSFVGGNPDENLYSILRFLASMPDGWSLPIVWNSHAYSTRECIQLLKGVVDVYVPDFKYGNNACGQRLSGIADYCDVARQTLQAMAAQQVPLIVRILVLPGHTACCHKPALEFLTSLETPWLQVSIRDQYCPDGKITAGNSPLSRRPESEEIHSVRQYALDLGLNLVDE